MQIETQKRYRLFLIVLVYLALAISGFISPEDPERMGLHVYLIYLFFALILTHISIVDSRIEGRPIPVSLYWLVLVFYGIAVPICIIRAHGIKKGLKIIILNLFGFILVLFLSFYIYDSIFYGQ